MDQDKNLFFRSLILPLMLLSILWVVKTVEYLLGANWYTLGIYPREISGIWKILTSSFIHGDFYHLFSNSVPLLVCATLILYFYRGVAVKVFIWIFILNGIWVWLLARSSYHIGISGWVYGLVAFLFLSGVLRKDSRMMAISLLMVFLYGGMVWGMLPIEPGVSWESHILGAMAGLLVAVFYRKEGPQRQRYDWEDDDEYADDDDENDSNITNSSEDEWKLVYWHRKE